MTVEELAKYLKIKPDTIYKKVRKGELPAIKLGKLLRFPKELVDQWLVEQAHKTAKARELLTNRVEKVAAEVNKRAKAAQKVIHNEVPELLEDVKNAAFSDKSETLRKGLKVLWRDLNKEVTAPLRRAKATKRPAIKVARKPKKTKTAAVSSRKASKKNTAVVAALQ